MGRQLNLRVSDEFADKLERVARSTGRPMAVVLESVGTPALDAVEDDARFEAEALAAWDDYQLRGASVEAVELDRLFTESLTRARTAAKRRAR